MEQVVTSHLLAALPHSGSRGVAQFRQADRAPTRTSQPAQNTLNWSVWWSSGAPQGLDTAVRVDGTCLAVNTPSQASSQCCVMQRVQASQPTELTYTRWRPSSPPSSCSSCRPQHRLVIPVSRLEAVGLQACAPCYQRCDHAGVTQLRLSHAPGLCRLARALPWGTLPRTA